jgi:hypothetical protein
MSDDQSDNLEAPRAKTVRVAPKPRIVEGEVRNSSPKNGTAYPHALTTEAPTQIEEGELAYHRRVITQANQAQAILQSWLSHLAEKYQLPQGTRIDEYGQIARAVTAEASELPQE